MPIHSPSHIAVEDLCEFMYFSSFIFFLHFVLSTVVGNRNVFPLPFLSVSHCNMSISFLPFSTARLTKAFIVGFRFKIQIRTIFLSHFPSFFPARHTSNSSIQFLCAHNGIYQDFVLFIRCRFLFFLQLQYVISGNVRLTVQFFFSSITSCICFVFCIFFLYF